MKLGKRN